MKKIRLNYIRNHYLRFGISGIIFLFKRIILNNKKILEFKHSDYQYKVYLRNLTTDINTFYSILFNKEYNINFKEEPKIIIDLGANIGLSSIFFLNKFPESKVIAVEPEKSNYEMLVKNISNYSNAILYNKGIWNKNATLKIKDNGNGKWGFSVFEVLEKDENTIDAISISEIIKQNNIKQIDILKIDIEGAEIELFSENFDMWLSITKLIIIELHDWMREGCARQFFKTIVKYNFELSHKGENLICYIKNI